MTGAQFDALAQLLRIRPGPAQEAARLVLVFGHASGEAAALTGLSPAGVSNAVARFRRGLKLAQSATADSAQQAARGDTIATPLATTLRGHASRGS